MTSTKVIVNQLREMQHRHAISQAPWMQKLVVDAAERIERLEALLRRTLPYIEQDVAMMSAITRHSPLDPESQAIHDNTESDSEKLLPLLKSILGEASC
jgi:hypothetical protein